MSTVLFYYKMLTSFRHYTTVKFNTFLPGAGEFNDLSELFLLKIPGTVSFEIFSVKTMRVRLLNCPPKGRKMFPMHAIRNHVTSPDI